MIILEFRKRKKTKVEKFATVDEAIDRVEEVYEKDQKALFVDCPGWHLGRIDVEGQPGSAEYGQNLRRAGRIATFATMLAKGDQKERQRGNRRVSRSNIRRAKAVTKAMRDLPSDEDMTAVENMAL